MNVSVNVRMRAAHLRDLRRVVSSAPRFNVDADVGRMVLVGLQEGGSCDGWSKEGVEVASKSHNLESQSYTFMKKSLGVSEGRQVQVSLPVYLGFWSMAMIASMPFMPSPPFG